MCDKEGQQTVRIALDWTANTTHTALLSAQGKGFFEEEGLHVVFVEPTEHDAPQTPLRGVLDSSCTMGVCPCDEVLQEHLQEDRVCCVATICHTDVSAVAVLKSSEISSPGLLGGCKYASCRYPLETACINAMIKNDGGEGRIIQIFPPERIESETMLLQKDADCSWIYRNWEVLRAKQAGIELVEFRPNDFGVPFGYMNTLCVSRGVAEDETGQQLIRKVLRAAGKGAEWAAKSPHDAGILLSKMAKEKKTNWDLSDAEFNEKSIQVLNDLGALCPKDDAGRWASFVAWSFSPGPIKSLKFPYGPDCLNLTRLYTNEFLEGGDDDDGNGSDSDSDEKEDTEKKKRSRDDDDGDEEEENIKRAR